MVQEHLNISRLYIQGNIFRLTHATIPIPSVVLVREPALGRLLERPYWTRAWVVQEALLPRCVLYCCGTRQIAGLVFFNAHTKLFKHEIEVRCCPPPTFCRTCRQVNAMYFCAIRNYMGKLMGIKNGSRTIDLLDLVTLNRQRQCQNPLDRIFAYLGLASPFYRSRIPVNYEASEMDVVLQLFVSCMQAPDGLRIFSLLYNVDCAIASAHPSWLSFWNAIPRASSSAAPDTQSMCYNLFNCARSQQVQIQFDNISNGELISQSIQVDCMNNVGEAFADESYWQTLIQWISMFFDQYSGLTGEDVIKSIEKNIPEMKIELSTPTSLPYAGGGTAGNALYRTLTMDHDWPGDGKGLTRAGAEEPQAWWELLRHLILNLGTKCSCWSLEWVGLLGRLYSASLERAFFVTRQNFIGLGLCGIREGDEIHIIPGGKCPVVLRRVGG